MVIEGALGAAAAIGVAGVLGAARGRRDRDTARRRILRPCYSLFDGCGAGIAPDGYPRVEGAVDGRRVRLSLIPDTLAPRRLPQLWLVVSITTATDGPRLVLTARPRCEDHIASGYGRLRRAAVPSWLPHDFAVRHDGGAADQLAALREPLQALFADPLVKEVAFAPGRIEMVYRLAEGRRGAHLLLRQACFDVSLEPELVRRLLGLAARLEDAASVAVAA